MTNKHIIKVLFLRSGDRYRAKFDDGKSVAEIRFQAYVSKEANTVSYLAEFSDDRS